jgi:hypothetical protein
MHAKHGKIGHIDHRKSSPLLSQDLDPPGAVLALPHGDSLPIIAHMFVLACEKTIVASLAFLDIDHQIPPSHSKAPCHFSI